MPTKRESEVHEYKQSVAEWREIAETIAAFATARGGIVHVGYAPDGTRVGVQVGANTIEQLANRIKDSTDPPQYPSIEVDEEDGPAVITVTIEASPVKPVWAFGRPYRRVGATNQRLTREEATRLVEQTTGRTWDALPNDLFTPEDVDPAAVREFLRRAGLDREMPADVLLQRLKLYARTGGLTHVAALLFAEEPYLFVRGAELKCGRFRGRTAVHFLDERTLTGNVLTQYDEALAFITRNTRQGFRISRAEREVVPEYPDAAVREALINAICHRDYAASGTIQVRIFDDRLEIWNPGILPFDLTIEQLYGEHVSHPRNLLLADVLFRLRLIEKWGSGTNRIVDACKPFSIAPAYRHEQGCFVVTIPSTAGLVALPEGVVLNERQYRVVEHVYAHGPITSSQHAAITGVGVRQSLRELQGLVELGVLQRVGEKKGMVFRLPE